MRPVKAPARTIVGKGELMPDDAVCAKCSYSLRGLRSGGLCPECGTPINSGRRRKYFNDTMTDAPVQYLRILAAGCWMLAIGAVASSVCLWAGLPYRTNFLAGAAGAAVLWCLGVFIVTAPRQTVARSRAELKDEWRRTRPLALAGQLGWFIAGAAFAGAGLLHDAAIRYAASNALPLVATPAEQLLRILAWVAYFLGIAGLVPLCLILADLSDWAGNSSLGDRFRDSIWALCVGAPLFIGSLALLKAVPGSSSGPLGFGITVTQYLSALAVTVGSILFLASVVRLAGMSLWAVSNAETGAERDERLAERQRRHEDELAARVYAAPPPVMSADSRTSAPVRTGPLSTSQGHYMPRPGAIKPYDLAPEDDTGPR